MLFTLRKNNWHCSWDNEQLGRLYNFKIEVLE